MTIPIPPGVFDITPSSNESWATSHLWNYLESVLRDVAKDYGYQEIRTPIFERTELFQRGVGSTTDIVSKEMYTFTDKGDRSLTLRPEGTAPVIRSYIDHGMAQTAPIQKLFYIGPMFRYERAQAGRYRQHHQFGVEAIGIANPEQDAEIIDMVFTLYERLGLTNLKVGLNSIGNKACREAFKEKLCAYLELYKNDLSKDSQQRLISNPLRILDSKDPKDKEIVANAPSILDFLDEECREHFETVCKLLNNLKIPYEINPLLVRGLDYYNKTVFEITAGELGAQNSIAGGGRYDGLLKTLGGQDLPTVGFATGLERVIQTMLKQEVPIPPAPSPQLFIIPLGNDAREKCFSLVHDVRQHGIAAQMELSGKKLGKAMQLANQLGARYTVVIGENELSQNEVELKDMSDGTSTKVPLHSLGKILNLEKKSFEIIKLWQEMDIPYHDQKEKDFFMQKLSESLQKTSRLSTGLQTAVKEIKEILEM